MPAAERAESIVREGDALRFSGALLAATVPLAWRHAATQALPGVTRFDLRDMERVDSADGIVTASSLTVDFTLSTRCTVCSMLALSASVAASPVSSTVRL